MKLVRWEQLSVDETLERFRKTRLKGFDRPYIYAKGVLSLQRAVSTDDLVPAQRYVLQSDLDVIFALEALFSPHGVDIYALEGAILFWVERDGEVEGPIPLAPPVVEVSEEADGRRIFLINDGMHRVTAARRRGRPIHVILAEGVPSNYPYYALPLSRGWVEVETLLELPDSYQKKAYRFPENYKALFRDFNEVFPGIQKQRKKTNEKLMLSTK
ncbi:ParB domain-containing protein [Azospirillaceae bacterium]